MNNTINLSQFVARVVGANTTYTCPAGKRAKYYYDLTANAYWWNTNHNHVSYNSNMKLNGVVELKAGDAITISRTTPVATGLTTPQVRAAIVQLSINGSVFIDLQSYVFINCTVADTGNVNGLTVARYLVEEYSL